MTDNPNDPTQPDNLDPNVNPLPDSSNPEAYQKSRGLPRNSADRGNKPSPPPGGASEESVDDEFPILDPNAPAPPDPLGYDSGSFDNSQATPTQNPTPRTDARSSGTTTESPPPSDSSQPSTTLAPSPIDKVKLSQIPIKVQLEVARMNVSLDELQRMKPGQKLPLEINPKIVNLVVNGKSIGQGEIVEIGDVIGVRIIELHR